MSNSRSYRRRRRRRQECVGGNARGSRPARGVSVCVRARPPENMTSRKKRTRQVKTPSRPLTACLAHSLDELVSVHQGRIRRLELEMFQDLRSFLGPVLYALEPSERNKIEKMRSMYHPTHPSIHSFVVRPFWQRGTKMRCVATRRGSIAAPDGSPC